MTASFFDKAFASAAALALSVAFMAFAIVPAMPTAATGLLA